MSSQLISDASARHTQPRPEVRPGYTVRVHERIQEGAKERIQVFEGLVIAVHKGMNPTDTTFTVRRLASGIGVERVFPLHSPKIEQIEVKKVARVRRSKLFFLRGRRGKAARLSERFTTADEFAVAAPAEEEVVEEAPATEEATSADITEEVPKTEEQPAEEPKEEATTEEKKTDEEKKED